MSQVSPVSTKKPKTSFRAKIVLALVGVLIPLLLVEAVAHLFPHLIPLEFKSVFQNEEDQPLKGLTPDPDLGYKYAPDLSAYPVPFENDRSQSNYHISTVSLGYDQAGFRDDGLEGRPFAVVIGDSYASCASVEMAQCWVELLEKKSGRDFANLGVVGYGPQQERRMLAKYGLPLEPELVLWVFFANDLDDAWQFDRFGTGAAREGKFWQNPVRAWLARNSAIYTVGAFFWYNRHLFYNLARADGELIPRDSNLIWWLTHTDLTIPDVAEGFALTRQAILEAYAETRAGGAEFVVVILPFREQVYAPAALQGRLDGLNEALITFCREQQIPVLDLTPALRAAASGEPAPIYFSQDIHLNERGNEIVAQLLFTHPLIDE